MTIPDRTSKTAARKILSVLVKDATLHTAICSDLALFWRYAARNFPDKSFITLATNYVRLNVGMVETFVIRADYVLIIVDRMLIDPGLESAYASLPDAHPIQLNHLDYVEHAAQYRSAIFSIINKLGKTRKHPTAAKAHSPGLAQALDEDIPHDFTLDHPDEVPSAFSEGYGTQVTVNRYERDPRARDACLQHFRSRTCQICGFDFVAVYGDIGREFIHVHHLRPLSTLGGNGLVKPEMDLLPVCPNCHAMLHTRQPDPWSPEELVAMMKKAQQPER